MSKRKEIRHDHASFDVEYYKDFSEADFIKDQLPAVPDNMGTDEQKIAWLKEAYVKVTGKPASTQDAVAEKPATNKPSGNKPVAEKPATTPE